MPPPLSDTNFVDEGSLIGIRQTEEDPKTWKSREEQNQGFSFKIFDKIRFEWILSETPFTFNREIDNVRNKSLKSEPKYQWHSHHLQQCPILTISSVADKKSQTKTNLPNRGYQTQPLYRYRLP